MAALPVAYALAWLVARARGTNARFPGRASLILLAAAPLSLLAFVAQQLPSYGPRGTGLPSGARGTDEAHLDRLRSLGYID